MRPLYVMLVGLPASGKTTLCREILSALPRKNWHVVSTDDYIEAEAARMGTTYDAVFQDLIDVATKEMNGARQAALSMGRCVLHDQTNLTVRSRGKKLASVPKKYLTIGVFCEVDPIERARRAAERTGKAIPADVDLRMVKSCQFWSDGEFDLMYNADECIEALRAYA